ncbi:hypothetical protein B0A50_03735 [Salinomyces thailandicus]|uniref:Membrane protein PTM1 n=1 Tax=Salinomyces thailandicus TaxID=706561 RepID=A0A4U0U4Y9_9PEZI|nr:hypothetical protein B0A50_03735 [Salinomyces thailandica]
MPSWRGIGLALLHLAALTQAIEMKIDQKENNRQVCAGMYSRKSWGGNTEPFIMTKFLRPDGLEDDADPLVSLAVFEWKDKPLVGKVVDGTEQQEELGLEERVYICDQTSVDAGYCSKKDLGGFILADNATEMSTSELINLPIHLAHPDAKNYHIAHTGYYCVGTFAYSDHPYTAVVEFRNAFGDLPAAQIAKLPFYASLTIVYAFLALGWAVLYYFHRHDILAVQNYLTAILIFLVVETFLTWLFYDYQNRHGFNTGAKALLVISAILSAARTSFSLFLLLLVCMGYGVVVPSLGRKMLYVRALALTHFTFNLLYALASLTLTPESAGPLILLIVLPLSATLTTFYIWTLSSLNATLKDLTSRKQTVKAGMYRRLWWAILVSILVIFAFFFLNSWSFAGTSREDFVPKHWQTRWFILDGWLNLVFLADVAFVAYVWRPSANNRRFAMSDEIAQDDDGFEIASLRDSFDFDLEDPEADGGLHSTTNPNHTTNNNGNNDTKPPTYFAARDQSPLPAPTPQKPSARLRQGSFGREVEEEEGMFALGEEDEGSEGSRGSSDEEGKGLTGGNNSKGGYSRVG